MQKKHLVIVGAGVGGLATALRLAHRGHQVTVLEKTGAIGGRNRRHQVGDCRFDGGPTLLMMLDPFRKLFADVGESFDERVPHRLCDPGYRVFFADGTRIDATTQREQMVGQIRQLAGKRDADQFEPFLEELEALYDDAIPNFVRTNFSRLGDVVRPAQLARVARHGMLGNLAKRVEARFRDPRLQMLFSFQTMYLGLSPFHAPWVYATLAYMEFGEGIWYPQGGLPAISEAIADLAVGRGVDIRLNCPVSKIEGATVTLESGESIRADAVISNADLPYTDRVLAGKPRRRKLRYSCSSQLLYIDYEGDLPGLLHHNVIFGSDYRRNFNALFHEGKLVDDPAFYVCLAKRSDPTVAPEGRQSLFVLIPVPTLERPMSPGETERIEASVFDRLVKEAGFGPSRVRSIERRGPEQWRDELNLEHGAAFGISHDLFQSAFMRPKNRSPHNRSLYYVGASTVPGNGLPMVLISAELVVSRLIEDGVISG